MQRIIREATLHDAERINEIYNHYVDHSTCTFQLNHETIGERLAWFDKHGEFHPIIVSESENQIVGWACISQWNSRCGYSKTGEISVYVDAAFHRLGIGRELVRDLIDRAKLLGYHSLIAGACTEQVASIKLQSSLGFEQVAMFREVGYKFDRWLDVTYLQLKLK
jgi:phosphinothricin acetyltransferase